MPTISNFNENNGNSMTDFCPMFKKSHHDRTTTKGRVAWRVETLGWGSALIWVGVVFLAEISIGPALLGLAAITLSGQFVRWLYGIPTESFWLGVGGFFLLFGIWNFFAIALPLIPVLITTGGTAIVIRALLGRS